MVVLFEDKGRQLKKGDRAGSLKMYGGMWSEQVSKENYKGLKGGSESEQCMGE